ncbi:MarR family transcriptional regulator [Umezawaea sp. Da 62-37]|uniref:MarR family winged helix-turn-helix transcriptional regulator n=1 Tax=Umezawaea sp. Da 62-37 TaxID=3075927 RepID=UPI0028F6EA37|nr:MarR family transcriptional regulator [Umezawaea sp. Da 62-37]WNV85407.1 MarR family transcriptional regulator [Umezawaea sp. Da 62-37]
MARPEVAADDVDALTDAVLTASRLLVAVSARSIAAVEETITLAQLRLLVVLDSRGPMKLIGLAELLAVNPSAATRMVDRLVAVDMVDRRPNPATRREVVIGLTPVGEQVVRGVTRRRRAEIASIVARMPEPARYGLIEALVAFAEAGGEPPVDVPPGDLAWF